MIIYILLSIGFQVSPFRDMLSQRETKDNLRVVLSILLMITKDNILNGDLCIANGIQGLTFER